MDTSGMHDTGLKCERVHMEQLYVQDCHQNVQ